MSLLDAYADTAGEAYDRELRNPRPDPGASFTGVGLLAMLPSAALQATASFQDLVAGAEEQSLAADEERQRYYAQQGRTDMLLPPDQMQRRKEVVQQLQESARATRRRASEFAPDPLTTHTADQVINNIGGGLGKAVGSVAVAGPTGGALLFGLEGGNTTYQDLIEQGVDPATAAKVGAVTGVANAAGVRVPVGAAGATLATRTAKTVGLVAAAGPGAFMAQEALTRNILQQAGEKDQASLHNPFDPLGLTISLVLPGVFGGFHVRGETVRAGKVEAGALPLGQLRPEELRNLKYNDPRLDAYAAQAAEAHGVPPALLLAVKNAGEKSGPTAVSGKGAQGVMQFMAGTAKEMGLADRTDPVASIDAGARYLKKLYDAYGSWDAAVAHYNGGGVQAALVRSGGAPTAKETIGYLARVRQYMADHTAGEAAKDPAAVDAARVAALNDVVGRSLPDTPDAVAQVQRAADAVAESGGRMAERSVPEVHVVDPDGTPVDVVPGTRFTADEIARTDALHAERADLLPTAGDLAERGAIRQAREELKATQDAMPDTGDTATRQRAKDIQEQEGVSYKAALSKAKKQLADEAQDVQARIDRLTQAIETNAKAQQAVQRVGEIDKELAALQKQGDQRNVRMRAPDRTAEPAAAADVARFETADNALPAHDSVALEGDEPAKPGEELGRTQREAAEKQQAAAQPPAKPKDPEAVARELELLQKRHSTLQTLLECLGGAA